MSLPNAIIEALDALTVAQYRAIGGKLDPGDIRLQDLASLADSGDVTIGESEQSWPCDVAGCAAECLFGQRQCRDHRCHPSPPVEEPRPGPTHNHYCERVTHPGTDRPCSCGADPEPRTVPEPNHHEPGCGTVRRGCLPGCSNYDPEFDR